MISKIATAISLLTFSFETFAQDSIHTVAGRALQNGAQDGPALEARFNDPAAIACDAAGNIYVADSRNNVIRLISSNGAVTTIATSGWAFDTPSGLAISPQGLIVSDTGHHVIRRINADGSITTLAGIFSQAGSEDGPAAAARFDTPLGLAVATNGLIYVADCGNHTIRAISPDGAVTTIAGAARAWGATDGSGTAVRFNGPVGLALDPAGNLFVSDSNNHTIRKITPAHEVAIWAGTPFESGYVDGDRRAARFFQPAELALDAHGALYIADAMNHAIRKISPDGKVTTIAGVANRAGSADGENRRARMYNPYGLAALPSGALAVADSYNQTIRSAIPPTQLQITFSPTVTITWNAIIGKTYQLESAAPSLAAWLSIATPITAATQTITIPFQPSTPVSILRLSTSP
jgi:sugar lactone lactonase YvrE